MSRLTLQRITKTPKILTNSTESMELKMIKIERLFLYVQNKNGQNFFFNERPHTSPNRFCRTNETSHSIQNEEKSRRFGVVVKPIITLIIFA